MASGDGPLPGQRCGCLTWTQPNRRPGEPQFDRRSARGRPQGCTARPPNRGDSRSSCWSEAGNFPASIVGVVSDLKYSRLDTPRRTRSILPLPDLDIPAGPDGHGSNRRLCHGDGAGNSQEDNVALHRTLGSADGFQLRCAC